jgi:hypothetical protein
MARLYLRRTVSGLAVHDGDLLDGWKVGDVLQADIVKPRNGGLHRKAFALVKMMLPHTDYSNQDTLRDAMTIAAGYVMPVTNPLTGEVTNLPISWSFKGMDDAEFGEFFNRLVDVALLMIPGSTREDWEAVERELVVF